MRERFELREGKWGMYFHDMYNGNDLPLKEVLDFLNAMCYGEIYEEPEEGLDPFDEKLHKIVDSYKFEETEEESQKEADKEEAVEVAEYLSLTDSKPSKPKDFYLGEKGFVVIEPKGGEKGK